MDHWERKFISEFDTFNNGLNSTKGGQGRGWMVAMREGIAKKAYMRFLNVYMPAFRDYYQAKGHLNVPKSHLTIGPLMINIRSGNTQIPPQFEEELHTMGVDMRNQHIVKRDKIWEEEYMPAFRDYYQATGDLNVVQSHPIKGSLMSSFRRGHTQIPPQFKEELRHMNLFLCTFNLARHVMRTLGRTVDSLEDADVREAVKEAAEVHTRLLVLRKGIQGKDALMKASLLQIPFGLKPLGDGTARFVADLKRLDKAATGKRKRSKNE